MRYIRNQDYELVPADKKLVGPFGELLETERMFRVQLKFRKVNVSCLIYIVKMADQCLLSRQESLSLKLITQCNQIVMDPIKEFQALFDELMSTPYEIKLKPDAKPYCLSQSRRVSLPLMQKLKQKLDEMLKMKVIKQVDEPTDWCNGFVIVEKTRNGGYSHV